MQDEYTVKTKSAQALNHPVMITSFPNQRASVRKELRISMRKLAGKIKRQTAASKDKLPWLKLATFGDVKSAKGCLRTNANVATITGLEADYDAGRMTPVAARTRLAKAGVAALIYTTPSHTPDAPRWRVLCPFSGPLPPDAREDLMARLNGVLGGGLDPASFTLSQAYYAGGVEGGAKVQAFLAEGDFIDNVEGLKSIYKDGGKTKPKRGESTGEKTGLPRPQFRDALMHIPNPDSADRDYWFKMMCGVHHETDGSEEGLAMILEWSESHPSYDYDETVRVWESIGREEGGATGATILSEAKFKGGWVDLSDLDEMFNSLAEIDAMLDDDVEETKQLARGYDLTEDGIIRAFTDRHEGELLYDHTATAWYRFVRHIWVREKTLRARHYARAVSTELAKRDPKAKHLKKVAVWEAIERGAKTVPAFAVTSEVWDPDLYLLGTPGGVVDLRTGKLRAGRPNDHISKATAATPVPLSSFDPDRHCPRWIAFLNEALGGDAEAIRFLQQWFGYCLTGYTSEHALLFIYGPGGSGKTTILNIMAELMGAYAIHVATSTLTKKTHQAHAQELARLDGARLASVSETTKGVKCDENLIKSLTGGDRITANFMRQNSFEFVPQMKLVIVGNNQPSLSDVDTAIQRRFNILPFDHPPKRKDPKLMDKLRRELPGILTWAMQGALDWKENRLVRPEVVRRATQDYFDTQDTFGQWLADRCEIGTGYQETSEALWVSWLGYANANGEEPGSKTRTFPETLKQRSFESVKNVRGKRGRGFKGIRLKEEPDNDGDELI
jgi:P4 family phage/plasmid primase-like protien